MTAKALPDIEPAAWPTPTRDPPLLAVENARVRFGKTLGLRDVSLSLGGGQLLGLIGPNGAGKTTLLRTIVGLQPTERGVVRIFGEPLLPDAVHLRRHIGFTADEPAVYAEMTVRAFLRFIAKGYDLPRGEADERIAFWLDKVWLSEKADAKIKQLSRGMRQRIGIARTLLPNPSLVLLDEPAAGLDPAGRVQFRQLLADLREQGKAIIISSHILADLSEYCTHVGIMQAGRMVRFGTVAQVSDDPDRGGRCRYTLTLAAPVARVEQRIGAIEGVSGVTAERDRVTLEFGKEKTDAAQLLATLITLGVPVASFAVNAAGLEEAYLRAGIRQVD